MGGVEVSVEGECVVAVAHQGSDAVVMNPGQGVADRLGDQRMRAHLHERRMIGTGRSHRAAELDRIIQQVERPIVGID